MASFRVIVGLALATAAAGARCGSLVAAHELQDSLLGLNEIVWVNESSGVYIGSPSVVRTSTGTILASSDRFMHGPQPACWSPSVAGQRWETDGRAAESGGSTGFSVVYRSTDNGTTWAQAAVVQPSYWATLFVRDTDVYIIGTTDGDSAITIGRSTDDGATWTTQPLFTDGKWGTGPTPVLFASDGNVYRAFELNHDEAQLMYAPATADLMNPNSWNRTSNPMPLNSSWYPFPSEHAAAYIEGNAVEGPDGTIYNFLRVDSFPTVNKALLHRFDKASNTLVFDRVIDFPGGQTKFTVRRDAATGTYFSLTNNVTDLSCPSMRDVLTLVTSPDLFTWTIKATLLHDDTGFQPVDAHRYSGFQYVDWQFDGDDIMYAVRTAYRGAFSYHNANRLTFKRLTNYKQYA